jgi:MATE family, multidrug efflux pump
MNIAIDAPVAAPPTAAATPPRPAPLPMDARTLRLLAAPILPTLLLMAWPNILIMLAQASVGLIETWWVSHLGTDALAGMALVFPGFMMMQMISAGAMGGGISSAVARALGSGRREDADALILHALLINLALGLAFSAAFLAFGSALYRAMGGQGASLEAALRYSNVVFAGNVLIWLMNALASAIRGTGNMLVPSLAVSVGVLILVPLSPLLIFGLGPVPALGIAGAGVAVTLTSGLTALVLALYILSRHSLVRFAVARLQRRLFVDILKVGAVGSINTLQTSLTVALTTALVGLAAGPDAVAGFGTGTRLEYLLIPLVFGLGAPLVALVGTNIGAGQRERALRIAMIGAGLAFAMTEAIGLAAAVWPLAWLGLFDDNPQMLETGAAYLRIVGPTYGFFGLGLCLYFASQGAGRLLWPLLTSLLRMVLAVGGGWIVLQLTGSLTWVFVALAVALVVYGTSLAAAVGSGVWFRRG